MLIATSRFGPVEIEADDILLFPSAIAGFEDCRHWVLLADSENDAVGWLQSISKPDLALAVVSPRRFVPEYQVRVSAGQLTPLQFQDVDEAYVLTVVNNHEGVLTLNLRAPLIINLNRRLGCQVATSDEQPVQYEVARTRPALRKVA